MEYKAHAIALFVLFGLGMMGISAMMHEAGHAAACAAQGFEVIEVNLLSSYVVCSASNQAVWIMGGGLGSIAMVPFLYVKKIRAFLPVSLGFFTAMLTQFLGMLLEGFWNPMYKTLDLENYALVFGLAMLAALWWYYRSELQGWYSIKLGKTDPPANRNYLHKWKL